MLQIIKITYQPITFALTLKCIYLFAFLSTVIKTNINNAYRKIKSCEIKVLNKVSTLHDTSL